jgi:hypothetical protein
MSAKTTTAAIISGDRVRLRPDPRAQKLLVSAVAIGYLHGVHRVALVGGC